MRSTQGFSLVELMIALTILSIILTVGLAKLPLLFEKTEVAVLQKTLAQHISLAKSTAANSGLIVTLCPSEDYAECRGSWTRGSMIFIDRNGNRKVDSDDVVIRIRENDIRQGKLEWRAFGRRQYLQFDPKGYLLHQSGNFTYCDLMGDPTLTRQLIVNSVGRVRIATDSNGDNIREDSRGKPIKCS